MDLFPVISPVITVALDSLQMILGNLDIHASRRDFWLEIPAFREIVKDVEAIFNEDYGSTLITPALVKLLENTFLRLMGRLHAPSSDVDRCICILMHLRHKLPLADDNDADVDEKLMSRFTFVDAGMVRDSITYRASKCFSASRVSFAALM